MIADGVFPLDSSVVCNTVRSWLRRHNLRHLHMSVDANVNWLVRTMYIIVRQHVQIQWKQTIQLGIDGNKQSEIYPCHEVAVIMPHMHISVKYHNP